MENAYLQYVTGVHVPLPAWKHMIMAHATTMVVAAKIKHLIVRGAVKMVSAQASVVGQKIARLSTSMNPMTEHTGGV